MHGNFKTLLQGKSELLHAQGAVHLAKPELLHAHGAVGMQQDGLIRERLSLATSKYVTKENYVILASPNTSFWRP